MVFADINEGGNGECGILATAILVSNRPKGEQKKHAVHQARILHYLAASTSTIFNHPSQRRFSQNKRLTGAQNTDCQPPALRVHSVCLPTSASSTLRSSRGSNVA